jgi:hypothetical protein
LKSGITRSHLRLHPVRVVGNEGFRHYPEIKKHTKEKNVSSNGEGVREEYLAIMVERVLVVRERREKKRIGGLGVG